MTLGLKVGHGKIFTSVQTKHLIVTRSDDLRTLLPRLTDLSSTNNVLSSDLAIFECHFVLAQLLQHMIASYTRHGERVSQVWSSCWIVQMYLSS